MATGRRKRRRVLQASNAPRELLPASKWPTMSMGPEARAAAASQARQEQCTPPDEWEVEAIVGRRVKLFAMKDPDGQGVVEFLVKWKGWSDEHNTWEPERNLANSIMLVIRFLSMHTK